jgi:hypothetical protein
MEILSLVKIMTGQEVSMNHISKRSGQVLNDCQLIQVIEQALCQDDAGSYAELIQIAFARLHMEHEANLLLNLCPDKDVLDYGYQALKCSLRERRTMDKQELDARMRLSAASLGREYHLPSGWADGLLHEKWNTTFQKLLAAPTFHEQFLMFNHILYLLGLIASTMEEQISLLKAEPSDQMNWAMSQAVLESLMAEL